MDPRGRHFICSADEGFLQWRHGQSCEFIKNPTGCFVIVDIYCKPMGILALASPDRSIYIFISHTVYVFGSLLFFCSTDVSVLFVFIFGSLCSFVWEVCNGMRPKG